MSGQGEENPDAGREKGRLLDKLKTGLEAMFAAQDDPSRGVNVDCESEDNETSAPNEPSERERQETVEAVLKIDTSATVVEINNIRLFSMDEVKLEKLTQCVSLSLRKNLIHDLVPLPEALANRLEELDLFDNKIRKLKGFFDTVRVPGEPPTVKQAVGAFQCITKLDLSYNQIREIEGLDSIAPTLRELYLVENKIKEIKNLDALVNLELLELGGNRLRAIGPGLANLTKLKQLWLGKNKIASIGTSLQSLGSLELLSLQANRLTSIEPENFLGSEANPNLRELYLSENGLSCIENVGKLSAIRIIDFSANPISSINKDEINSRNMPHLEEFWLTDGKIENWEEVGKLSDFAESLRTVYLERNPIEEDKRYRDKVYMFLPFLVNIDSWPIINKGNLEADRRRRA